MKWHPLAQFEDVKDNNKKIRCKVCGQIFDHYNFWSYTAHECKTKSNEIRQRNNN